MATGPLVHRVLLLCRRFVRAARFGFVFRGASFSKFPCAVILRGKRLPLTSMDDGGYLSDITNIWLDDEYGLTELGFVPKTIVDVGANIGLFSLLAWNYFPYARIHAYEPNPCIINTVKANLRFTSVKLQEAGVGSRSGEAVMVDRGSSRLSFTQRSLNGAIKIDSLSEVVAKIGGVVDLLKLDCEGAEWDILEAGAEFKKVREIRMEYHLIMSYGLADMLSRLDSLNFEVTNLVKNNGFGIIWAKNRSICS